MEAALGSWWLFVANSCLIWNLVLFCVLKRWRLLISPTVPCGNFSLPPYGLFLFSGAGGQSCSGVNMCLPFLDTATFPLSTSVKTFFLKLFYAKVKKGQQLKGIPARGS